ncbi:heavy metal translocating P-type ATPase [Leptolyngbya sp. NIES-2104]|uniref:heavy metal translocating P-type ATPase n=1 Tax=Leptolyngbya sp. NIES-2104 TaxID=1552121 RepID=UPI0006EC4BAC|nr:heavy metal translocating P-type ATPase [Leptolyngbya sp. NIES-2104]GAP94855.1 lead, cadmium, zinc and mercury transporting ATPase / copper-translocating P-type ATPase [Leptolyngbya sp. NIES-2104]
MVVATAGNSSVVTDTVVTIENVYYEIVHWMPGRFRIRIPRLAQNEEYGAKLKYLVESLNFVTEVRLNSIASSLIVEYRHESTAVGIATIQEKLFRSIQDAVSAKVDLALVAKEEKKSNNEIDWMERLGFPAAGLVLSVASMAGAPVPPLLIGGVVLVGAIPVFKRAWEAIQQDQQLTIDFLDGLAIALHTFQGHFFAPSFMLGLVEGGEAIRDMTARGSERASLDLLDCLSKTAFVIRDGQVVEIPTQDVIVGDHVVVYPGDQIPVDGVVLEGTGIIDQCKLTGESVPVTRSVGDEVFASTLLVDGTLTILSERVGNNTRAGVIVNLMQAAPVHDTRVENYAAAVANQAVLPTLLIGAGVGIFSGNLNRAVALLTLDFGTGIRVSVPTTILSVLTYAARNGVLIRSGRAIEILARIDTIVCDKTGTLTIGHAGVNDIDVMDDRFSKDEVLCFAASAEKGLTHPIAEAIVHHAKDTGVALKDCEEWEYKVGLGAMATIEGMNIIVGSPRFMKQENVSLDEYDIRYPDAKSGGQSLVYVATDGRLLGVIRYSDPPRPESKEVVKELKRMGITVHMLTGDVTRVAHSIAGNLGIEPKHVYAEAFPEKKVEVVKAVHDSGKTVGFCGDGINDSAALAYADVSISFAGATDIARETADVVLMEDDLRGLIMAIKCARQAMDIIWQNTAIVAVPNLGALVSGIFFALDPILAVVINNGTAILAELNGLRPLMGPGGEVMPPTHHISAAELAEEEKRLREMAEAFRQKSAPEPATPQEPATTTIDVVAASVIPQSNGSSTNGHHNGKTALVTEAVKSADSESAPSLPAPLAMLKQNALAQRLGIATQTITAKRSKPDFPQWSTAKDPEGIAWYYEPATKNFCTFATGKSMSDLQSQNREMSKV